MDSGTILILLFAAAMIGMHLFGHGGHGGHAGHGGAGGHGGHGGGCGSGHRDEAQRPVSSQPAAPERSADAPAPSPHAGHAHG